MTRLLFGAEVKEQPSLAVSAEQQIRDEVERLSNEEARILFERELREVSDELGVIREGVTA